MKLYWDFCTSFKTTRKHFTQNCFAYHILRGWYDSCKFTDCAGMNSLMSYYHDYNSNTTRASVATVVTTHPCVSRCLRVKAHTLRFSILRVKRVLRKKLLISDWFIEVGTIKATKYAIIVWSKKTDERLSLFDCLSSWWIDNSMFLEITHGIF